MRRLRSAALLVVVSAGAFAAVEDSRLIQAVRSSDHAAVRNYLNTGGNANARQADGTSAVEWAVSRDDLETVKLLIGGGADVKAPNRYGMTPLLIACNNASVAVVAELLKAGADPNSALPE